MKVRLLTDKSALNDMECNAAYAMLICHDNTEKLKREAHKIFVMKAIELGHESILEHINLSFEIRDLSRACLQELARHRHISLSVESTRHTLKRKIKDGIFDVALPDCASKEFEKVIEECLKAGFDYVVTNPDISNDVLKYAMPECLTTNLVMTLNVRELRHIVKLRSAPAALDEFQDLARSLVFAIPKNFRYWVKDCLYNEK